MVVTSAVLVATALGLLVAGILLPLMLLVYVSIIVSVLAALLLGVGAYLRRGEFFGGEVTTSGREEQPAQVSASRQPAMSATRAAGHEDSPERTSAESTTGGSVPTAAAPDAPAADIPGDTPVLAVPSRGTYHVTSCRKTRTRTSTELTYEEAREQGYTSCSSCLPDTVLAARGSGSVAAPDDAADTTGQGEGVDSALPVDSAELADAGDRVQSGSAAEPADATGSEEATAGQADESEAHAGLVGVVEGSHRYHRLTCAVVEDAVQDGIELATMSRDEAEAETCTPCTVCRP